MLISLKYKIAVFAMTKAGSTAIETALRPHCDICFSRQPRLKHMPVRKFERFQRPFLDSVGGKGIERFAVFRHPESWLGSWYRYRARPGIPDKRKSTAGISFEAFVEAYLAEERPEFAQVGNPAQFITDEAGEIGIEHLFQYEDFGRVEEFLSDRFQTPLSFERRNISPAGELALSPDLRARLRREMARSYEIWESLSDRN